VGGERTGGIRIYECHPGLVSKDSTTSPLVEPGISALGETRRVQVVFVGG